MVTVPTPNRGEIWLVNFDPAVGGEIRKLRPALVKQSGADAFQTKSVSITRFARRLGAVSASDIEAVASAIALCVGAS